MIIHEYKDPNEHTLCKIVKLKNGLYRVITDNPIYREWAGAAEYENLRNAEAMARFVIIHTLYA